MWQYGTEDAISLIPNFLVTGIAAMTVSVLIVVWAARFLRGSNGRTILLLLFVALTLVGGGIGHIPFFLWAWGYATRMNRPLSWWRRVLPNRWRMAIQGLWVPALATSSLCFIVGLAISVIGFVPGTTDSDAILWICWSFLGVSLLLMNLAYITGFAYDLERMEFTPAGTGGGLFG